MTRRLLVVVCCVLLAVVSTFAQARSGKAAKADPVSGTWTGTLTPQNAPGPVSVTMELKFDGKSAVTGTVAGLPNPAEVKVGTFESEERSAQSETREDERSGSPSRSRWHPRQRDGQWEGEWRRRRRGIQDYEEAVTRSPPV